MADFVGLGQDAASIASKCSTCNDKNDLADFVMYQQKMIRGDVIKQREEKKNKQNSDTNNSSDPKRSALSAYERLQESLNKK